MILKNWGGSLSIVLTKINQCYTEKLSWFIIGVVTTLGIFHLLGGNILTASVAFLVVIINFIVGRK